MVRRLIGTVMAAIAVGAVLGLPLAQADTGDVIEKQNTPPTAKDGFQAGTCTSDLTWPNHCSPATPGVFFTQAGGHPPVGFTQYIIRHNEIVPNALEETLAVAKTIRVDLPPGLTVNPLATEQCTGAAFLADTCPAGSQVGWEEVTVSVQVGGVIPIPGGGGATFPKNAVIPPTENPLLNTKAKLFNLVPEFGEPARFGFKIGSAKAPVYLEGDVAWESDYHAGFTIKLPPPNPLAHTLRSRLVNNGQAGDGTYITNPTTCFDPTEWLHLYSTWLRAQGIKPEEEAVPFPDAFTPWEAVLPPGAEPTGCDRVPFDPSLETDAGTAQVDSPAGATVTTRLPFDPAKEGGEVEETEPGVFEGISQSHVRSARVTLPRGMGLNPSGAQGLEACTDEQFRKGVRVFDNACPAASKIGTVEVDTPPLPDGSLKGDVYVGVQKSRDPTSGEEFRILAEAKSERFDVVARLVGKVIADPETGQLTAVFDDQLVGPFAGVLPRGLPQVPFKFVRLRFEGGSKAVLTSPPTCGPHSTTGLFEPWARPDTFEVAAPGSFTLSSFPGGGTCPTLMAERPFKPGYSAKSKKKKAGGKSPFRVRITRSDGEQELKVANVTLPNGLVGKLRGLRYCPEAAIDAAAARAGLAERGDVSCPDKSWLGPVSTKAGTGGNPLEIHGNAYLAGPYKGAPISLVTITPAVAGPFDLGTVVVRVALFVKPRTAQVQARSDEIPDVFGGVKLDLREVNVNVKRKGFMRNPTGCGKKKVKATLKGGGADPTNPATFSNYKASVPYRAKGCKKLGFEPRLSTRLLGGPQVTTRAKHPALRAVLEARKGDANIKRSAVTLPDALFLDQGNIRTVCTKPDLAAGTCPKAAIYGHARATTPLLAKPLKGPVYMTPSKHELPDLVADLRGQVNVRLFGVIGSEPGGGIRTVFNSPDVPVKKFVLTMKGGAKRGLLINSRNLCAGPLSSVMRLKAHNGKEQNDNTLPLKVGAC
jgi:hypothetical protein